MKHVISVSIGSSSRDKTIELELMGEKILVERIGTDGDLKKAASILSYYDGKADAFGIGGGDLGFMVDNVYYPLHSVRKIAQNARKTPLTDGMGLKNVLEYKTAGFIERHLSSWLDIYGRSVFLMVAISRWGMTQSFIDAGFSCTYGDLMFTLGLPLPVHSRKNILLLNKLFCPLITRLPFSWIYPFDSEDQTPVPKFVRHYQNSTVIAGDCIYLRQRLPEKMNNKIVVTNTTTESDIELFRRCGIKYIVTTTPVFEDRTFGTNVLEAIITALAGKHTALTPQELEFWIGQLHFEPQIRELN